MHPRVRAHGIGPGQIGDAELRGGVERTGDRAEHRDHLAAGRRGGGALPQGDPVAGRPLRPHATQRTDHRAARLRREFDGVLADGQLRRQPLPPDEPRIQPLDRRHLAAGRPAPAEQDPAALEPLGDAGPAGLGEDLGLVAGAAERTAGAVRDGVGGSQGGADGEEPGLLGGRRRGVKGGRGAAEARRLRGRGAGEDGRQ